MRMRVKKNVRRIRLKGEDEEKDSQCFTSTTGLTSYLSEKQIISYLGGFFFSTLNIQLRLRGNNPNFNGFKIFVMDFRAS